MRRFELPPDEYNILRLSVLARDRWKCKNPLCRSHRDLQVDHVIPRSELGPDDAANLCTLCADCHKLKGSHILLVIPNGDGTFRFHDTRRVLVCECCHKSILSGTLAAVPTPNGGFEWQGSIDDGDKLAYYRSTNGKPCNVDERAQHHS